MGKHKAARSVYEEVGRRSAKSFWERSWPRMRSIHQHMPSIEPGGVSTSHRARRTPILRAAKPPHRILGVDTIVPPNFQMGALKTKFKHTWNTSNLALVKFTNKMEPGSHEMREGLNSEHLLATSLVTSLATLSATLSTCLPSHRG